MTNNFNITNSDKIIWAGCYIWLILDSINGYFWNSGLQLPISQMIKSLLLLFVIYKLFSNRTVALSLVIVVIALNLNYISSAFYDYPFIGTIQHLSKILLTILLFIYFKQCIERWPYYEFEKRAKLVFKLGILVLFVNVYMGLLGLGYHTYSTGEYGYKGFFSSGNEMGGLVVALIPVLLYWAYFSLPKKQYMVCTIITLMFGVLLATKSVILVDVFFCIYIPYAFNKNKNKKRRLVFLSIIAIIIAGYIVFHRMDRDSTNFLIEFFYRYDKGGLLYLLLSARNEFVLEQFDIFTNTPFYQHLLGMGSKIGNIDTVEMDYFDIFFYYGYVGLAIMILLTIKLFHLVKKNKYNNKFIRVIKMSDILMITMAAVAGHILFSSTAGLYIALINSFLFSKKEYPLIDVYTRKKDLLKIKFQ